MSPKYPRWLNKVRVGDVLRDKNGSLRVVRSVCKQRSKSSPNFGLVRGISFAIKHCSWTGRCYTAINFTDVVARGFSPTGVNVPLNTALDKKIERDLRYENRFKQKTTCCDVEGAP